MTNGRAATTRAFRFGVHTALSTASDIASIAVQAEDQGYSTFLVGDHVETGPGCFAALTCAAMATRELRVGSLVLANQFRHPVVAAKELATIDVLSGGRLEVGMGAGWNRVEHEQIGLPLDTGRRSVDRLRESVEILGELWSGEAVDYKGEHYQLNGARLPQRPLQQPRPPLAIGGSGPAVLALAAQVADIVAVNPKVQGGEVGRGSLADMAVERFDDQVRQTREAAGARWGTLEMAVMAFVVAVTPRRDSIARSIAKASEVDVDTVLHSPFLLLGTVEEIGDELLRRRDRWGISYWVFPARYAIRLAPVVARLRGA